VDSVSDPTTAPPVSARHSVPKQAQAWARRRGWGLPLILGAIAGAVMLLRTFVPGPIGLADNGDGPRLMCQLGVIPASANTKAALYDNHAILRFVPGISPDPKFVCVGYPSSTLWVMRFARWVTGLLGQTGIDLRVTMAAYCIVVGALVIGVCRLVRRGWVTQCAAAVGLVLIAGDSTFVDYLGSPFTETAGLVGLLVLTVSGVSLIRADVRAPSRAAWLAVFTIAAAATVAAKVQTVTIAVPIGLFLLWRLLRHAPGTTSSRRLAWRSGFAVSLLIVIAAGATEYQHNPKQFALINPTDVIFVGILGPSHDPAADLQDMGLPISFAKYAGHSWWETPAPEYDPAFPSIQSKITYATIAHFLATHPGRTVAIAGTGADAFWAARARYLGNYPQGAAPSLATECRLCLLSSVMADQRELGLPALVILTVMTAAAAISLLRRSTPGSRSHSFASVSLLLNAIVAIQFVTNVYGEAIETTKHLVLAVLSALLCGYTLVFALLTRDEHLEATRST
jgi:hypothetical protein